MAAAAGANKVIYSVVLRGGIVEGEGEDMLTEFAWEALERRRHGDEAINCVSDRMFEYVRETFPLGSSKVCVCC